MVILFLSLDIKLWIHVTAVKIKLVLNLFTVTCLFVISEPSIILREHLQK